MSAELTVLAGGLVTKEDISLAHLEAVEAKLTMALQAADSYQWQAVLTLLHIKEVGLWRVAHDADGLKYADFESYLRDLSGRVPRLSPRWAQQMMSNYELFVDVLGCDQGEITETSPAKLREVRRTVAWDPRKPDDLTYRVEGGREEVLTLVRDAAAPETRLRDVRSRVSAALHKIETYYFWRDRDGTWVNAGDAVLTITHDDLIYEIELFYVDNSPPPAALADLKKRLGISPN